MVHKIIKGKVLSGKITEIAGTIKARRIFLVCGKSFENRKTVLFENPFIETVTFSDFHPNPNFNEIFEGIKLFNQKRCDAIVAIGGGSAIDTAKCIKLLFKRDNNDVMLYPPFEDTGIPLIAVPTTAGSGSEETSFTIFYKDGKKISLSSPFIIPDYVVLIPSLLETLPIEQKHYTVADALCQAIESFWSVNSTIKSREYSKRAIIKIMNNAEKYFSSKNTKYASEIMLAANYSGRAINITHTTAAHAMGYALTISFDLSHGYAVSICMLEVWKFILNNLDKCSDPRGRNHLEYVLSEISLAMGCNSREDAYYRFEKFLYDSNIWRINGIARKSLIEEFCNAVNPDRLTNTPVKITKEDIREIYSNILL